MSLFGNAVSRMDAQMLVTHGDSATYSPRAGTPYTITLVFDSGAAVQDGDRVYYTAWAPLTSFSSEPVKGDRVTIGDQQFSVRDIEKDSQTGRKLKLSCTSPI